LIYDQEAILASYGKTEDQRSRRRSSYHLLRKFIEMLDTLRKNSSGWVVKILLGLLIISFAVWGVGDVFRGGGRQTLGKVNGRHIDPNEYNRVLRNELRQQNISPSDAQAAGLPKLVLHQVAQTMLIDAHAEHLKLGIDEKLVIDGLTQMPAFADEEGKFNRAQFEHTLRESNMSETQLLNLQHRSMIHEQLLGTLTQSYVPQTLVEAFNRFRNDQRAIKYFVLPASVVGDVPVPDEAAQTAYYDQNKDIYKAPIYRKIGLLMVSSDTVKGTIKPSDEDIKTYYDANPDKFEVRTVQKLTFKTKEEADDAHKKLVEGADFVKLGKELGLKASEINIGTFARGKLPEKVAEVVFALEKDKISDVKVNVLPVIYRVTAIEQQPFEEAKATAQEELAKSRATDKLVELRNGIENDRDSGMNLTDIAKKLNIKLEELTFDARGVDTDGKPVESLSRAPEVLKQAFEAEVGDKNNPLQLDDGYAFVEVRDVIPERQKPLAEVQADVKSAWREKETSKRFAQKAEDLVSRAAKGEKFEALAQSVKATVTQTSLLKRGDKQSGLPSSVIEQAFILEDKGVGSKATADHKSQVVFQVTEIKNAPAISEQDAKTLRPRLQREMGSDILAQYVNALQNTYSVQLNSGAIPDASE
jgi:peptidyl-prolyl cis-trans isomerase D